MVVNLSKKLIKNILRIRKKKLIWRNEWKYVKKGWGKLAKKNNTNLFENSGGERTKKTCLTKISVENWCIQLKQ